MSQRVKKERKYVPTLGELIDRLTITQLKELLIHEHRKEYSEEIKDILHDIDLIIEENNVIMDADFVRNVIINVIMNLKIWDNEKNWRKGIREGNNLELTHGLNSVRNQTKNRMNEKIGHRIDYKLDNVEAFPEWVPSGY